MSTITTTTCARCATLVLALAAVTLGDAAATPLHGQNSTTTVNNSPRGRLTLIQLSASREILYRSFGPLRFVNLTD